MTASNEQTMATAVGHGSTLVATDYKPDALPKQVKGGAFATADMEILKRALFAYKDALCRTEESEREASDELVKVANLLHRIGRIA